MRTWGCTHNTSDSEYMAGQLAEAGFKVRVSHENNSFTSLKWIYFVRTVCYKNCHKTSLDESCLNESFLSESLTKPVHCNNKVG